ncbi:MAG: HDOD domain-containing protein [Phycisphaerales bacterium]
MAERLNQIIAKLDRLPALPTTLMRVTSMLADRSLELEALAGVVRSDEALSALVLRAANSATFGVPGREFDIQQSLARLGVRNIASLVLRHESSSVLENAGASYGLRRAAMSQAAIGGSAVAEMLAIESGFESPELAYTCALLRDIGKIGVDAMLAEQDPDHPFAAREPDTQFLQAERESLGFDHTQIGAALAEHWDLPPRVANAIRFHHNPPAPDDPQHDDLFDLVHAGDIACLWAGLGIGYDGLAYDAAPHVTKKYLPTRTRAEELILVAVDATIEHTKQNQDQQTGASA